jgi:hypothetical protein
VYAIPDTQDDTRWSGYVIFRRRRREGLEIQECPSLASYRRMARRALNSLFLSTMHTYQYVGIVLVVSRPAGAGAVAVVAELFPVRHGQVAGKLAGHETALCPGLDDDFSQVLVRKGGGILHPPRPVRVGDGAHFHGHGGGQIGGSGSGSGTNGWFLVIIIVKVIRIRF